MGRYFYGQNVRCRSHEDKSWCGGMIPAETQHYVYGIVAQHFLAVCYYAQNYPDEAAFSPWVHHTAKDGYCRNFKIPSSSEVRSRRGGSK